MATMLELTYELAKQEGKLVKQCPECKGYFISNYLALPFCDETCIYCLAGDIPNPIEKECVCGCGRIITNGGYPVPRNHIYYSRSCSVKRYRNDRKNKNK